MKVIRFSVIWQKSIMNDRDGSKNPCPYPCVRYGGRHIIFRLIVFSTGYSPRSKSPCVVILLLKTLLLKLPPHMPILNNQSQTIFVISFVTEVKRRETLNPGDMSSIAARNIGRLLPRLARAAERQRHLSSLTPISVTRTTQQLQQSLRTTLGSGYSSSVVISHS